jgi:anti-anti-sigma factor
LSVVSLVGYLAGIVSFDPHEGILRVSGEEDRVTAGRRRHALSAALKASRDVVVDLSELRFADSSLMIDLAMLARRLRLHGRNLSLRDAQPQVQTLIEFMGLHRLAVVAPSVA